ncbi:MAG: hypothetical protein A2599_00995 [Candidatus Staskawiczbacteria bacterium RIFOXYD1_FULL_39_28]|uniref:Prenyltransferase n=1 Tax=Candidatus Staskawiczbacteria bacterium RIFOXYC1_FULL_38_18 TaxID=1802229 RepID=A0A1G2JA98_9BACT|nr:MAG: hypothetical protein A2401_00715 [Candidatus Staskawiczbacteria bacterium RIFOXYC1_FULL_38_18]OGZ91412.1 MAG: hypothetical protein A2599_00995 [Candidatus Staskawiczbacteria bacterium RIFOXYD1_FULL_39_28]
MNFAHYIRLIKFRYHISFIFVILGALILADGPVYTIISPLLIVYLSFNICLYGGLYTLNDIADIESDRRHPKKKNRPLPSGKVSVQSAYFFAFTLISIGLAAAYLYFGKSIFLLYVFFILVNQIYTHIAKKMPYLEIIANSLTHPMRFLLGAMLVTTRIPFFLLLAVLFFAFAVACSRRIIEIKAPGWEARSILKHYTASKLAALQFVTLSLTIFVLILDYPAYLAWYSIDIALFLIFVFGAYLPGPVMKFYKYSFLN